MQPPDYAAKSSRKQNGIMPARKSKRGQRPTSAFPTLSTFPLEVGWREVYDPETNTYQQRPLTLQDLLFFNEDDIGVVVMSQSPLHDLLLWTIRSILHLHFEVRGWLTTQDVFVRFGGRGVAPKGPDIALIPEGQFPGERKKSYQVGRDGPPPAFIVEVTSEETRQIDLQAKPIYYASFGVQEFLIIDIETPLTQDWELQGYTLTGTGPFYRQLTPDADGGLTFPAVGLRFVPVGRKRVDVFDLATGERLLTPEEQKTKANAEAERANAEAERANTEAAARAAVEAQLAEAWERLRKLENQ
jgi:Uma2 family endonuclease